MSAAPRAVGARGAPPRVERLLVPPGALLGALIAESEAHGLGFVRPTSG